MYGEMGTPKTENVSCVGKCAVRHRDVSVWNVRDMCRQQKASRTVQNLLGGQLDNVLGKLLRAHHTHRVSTR